MNQVSHCHLVHVHGLSVKGSKRKGKKTQSLYLDLQLYCHTFASKSMIPVQGHQWSKNVWPVFTFADIMVEEFVKFGPLDVFLQKEKASISARWKYIVAIQLASALSYLVSFNFFFKSSGTFQMVIEMILK